MNKSLYISLLIVGIITLIAVLVLKSDQSIETYDIPDNGFITLDACENAENTLSNFLALQDKSCKIDSDCKAYYLMVKSCSAPVVLANSEFTRNLDVNEELLGYQQNVRENCGDEYSQGPVCEPPFVKPICLKGFCTDQATAVHQ